MVVQHLPIGTEREFQVSQEKASGRKRAVEVVLIRTSREKREEEQLKKVRIVRSFYMVYSSALWAPSSLRFVIAYCLFLEEWNPPRTLQPE